MAAKSSKYIDIYDWIVDVIHSCKTIEHCESTRNLIENFQKMGHKPDESRFQFTLGILSLKSRLNRRIVLLKSGEIR